jgi:signal transduction histidine kinase
MPALARLPTRATLLGVLLAVTLGLGGLVAVEAVRVARTHQLSVERFLDESAQAAAREFLSRSRDEVDALAADLMGGMIGQRAPSPFEILPPPDFVQKAAERALPCADAPVRAFRYDFRSDSLVFASGARREDAAQLARVLSADFQGRYRPAWHATLLVRGSDARPLLYGVRYSEFRAPLAAFGVEVCDAALGRAVFARALERGGLLATDVGSLPQDSLLVVSVAGPGSETLLAARAEPQATHGASATIERLAGVTATVALRPAATLRLAISPPSQSRVAALVALFALTGLLALVALLQLRREAALVRLRTDFTSSVSHELRTPLAQILLFGETLRLGRARTEADRQLAVDTIVEEGRRLMHLVDNLLQFDRAARQSAPLAVQPVRVDEVVQSARATFAPLLEAAQMTVALDVPPDLAVHADAAALRHVLLNFLDNAAKYGPAGQVVRIGAARIGDHVRITVDDQGPGVPLPQREAIWAPFARLDRDRRSTRAGSGIGLSVVRDLIARQQGRCTVDAAPGGGARFIVELPAAVVPA